MSGCGDSRARSRDWSANWRSQARRTKKRTTALRSPDSPEAAKVALVVPARNAARTLAQCLRAAWQSLEAVDPRAERLVVDDGSIDSTAACAAAEGARVLAAGGVGPGAARNLGWKSTAAPWIWFLDSDCEPEPDSLALLVAALESEPAAAGAGGSYLNLVPESLLATLIHHEILSRHRRMPPQVDHLGSFNVLLRRSALEAVGGFDESEYNGPGAPGAEDMDLSFRLRDAGWRLLFVPRSLVGHYHPVRLARYLRTQWLHGRAATRLFLRQRARLRRNSYTRKTDLLEPLLALTALGVSVGALAWRPCLTIALAALVALAALATLNAVRVSREAAAPKLLVLAPLGFIRSFARAGGLVSGFVAALGSGGSGRTDVDRRRAR